MTLEEVLSILQQAEREGKTAVRLHTGDPCLYGAIREQMDALDALGIPWAVCPGVSSFCGAAAALGAEYTLPGVSQSVIITRMAGRTPVPERESIAALAAHGSTMVVFLSAGLLEGLQAQLMEGGYAPDTPAAIVYKATWPEEKVLRCQVSSLAKTDVYKRQMSVSGDWPRLGILPISRLIFPQVLGILIVASQGLSPLCQFQRGRSLRRMCLFFSH